MISPHDQDLINEARRRDISESLDDLKDACESDEAKEQIRRIEIRRYHIYEYRYRD